MVRQRRARAISSCGRQPHFNSHTTAGTGIYKGLVTGYLPHGISSWNVLDVAMPGWQWLFAFVCMHPDATMSQHNDATDSDINGLHVCTRHAEFLCSSIFLRAW